MQPSQQEYKITISKLTDGSQLYVGEKDSPVGTPIAETIYAFSSGEWRMRSFTFLVGHTHEKVDYSSLRAWVDHRSRYK